MFAVGHTLPALVFILFFSSLYDTKLGATLSFAGNIHVRRSVETRPAGHLGKEGGKLCFRLASQKRIHYRPAFLFPLLNPYHMANVHWEPLEISPIPFKFQLPSCPHANAM